MIKFTPQIFSDPIILIAAFVVVAAITILVWAIINWQKSNLMHTDSDELSAYEDTAPQPPARQMESAGVFEAQLQEITCQLQDISTRLGTMEKTAKAQSADSEKTITYTVPPDVENTLHKLEAKLEGIHKLLIILTDSGVR